MKITALQAKGYKEVFLRAGTRPQKTFLPPRWRAIFKGIHRQPAVHQRLDENRGLADYKIKSMCFFVRVLPHEKTHLLTPAALTAIPVKG
ncbi:MAG: hypothetical protein JXA21_03585 [Anaerolineae bacterium]|nr:hypothetical protein [Anaerolineae bacterium]